MSRGRTPGPAIAGAVAAGAAVLVALTAIHGTGPTPRVDLSGEERRAYDLGRTHAREGRLTGDDCEALATDVTFPGSSQEFLDAYRDGCREVADG